MSEKPAKSSRFLTNQASALIPKLGVPERNSCNTAIAMPGGLRKEIPGIKDMI